MMQQLDCKTKNEQIDDHKYKRKQINDIRTYLSYIEAFPTAACTSHVRIVENKLAS